MINKIEHWSSETPTEEGDYLMCSGEEPTKDNVDFLRIVSWRGKLVSDFLLVRIDNISKTNKFAKLVY